MYSSSRTPIALALGLGLVFSTNAPALAKQAPGSDRSAIEAARQVRKVKSARPEARPVDTPDAGLAPDPLAVGMMWVDVPGGASGPRGDHPADAGKVARRARPAAGIPTRMAEWISASGDNNAMPFAIVDKLGAMIFVYDGDGTPLGSAPVLIGLARGDDSAPGVGGLKLADISPEERTTPAGRFVAQWGPSENHGAMLWVDFADSISMHPVMSVNAGEHRLARIKSTSPEDHRISYGCINLPANFYDEVVQPAFANGGGVIYVLPDTKPLEDVFPAFAAAIGDALDRREHARARQTARWDPLADPPNHIPDPPPERAPIDP